MAKQSEISRVGMIMKRVEEDCKARIVSMKTDYQTNKDKDREYNVLYFKVVFAKGEWSSFEIFSKNKLNPSYPQSPLSVFCQPNIHPKQW